MSGIAGSREKLKRDSEKSTESGGRPLEVEEAARVEAQRERQQLQAQGARIAALETQLQIGTDQSNDGRARKESVDSDSGGRTTLSEGSRKEKVRDTKVTTT